MRYRRCCVLDECVIDYQETSKSIIVTWISLKQKGLLVGFYGTAALYRLYSAGECSECENECACRVDGVVPPCTLEQWVNSPPPFHWGCVPSSMGVKPFYTLGQWAYSTCILPLTHRGNTRHYDILFNRQIVPVSMQYGCV